MAEHNSGAAIQRNRGMFCLAKQDCYRKSLAIFFMVLLLGFAFTLYGNVGRNRGRLGSSYRSITNETDAKPEVLHISFGQDPSTEMIILWATKSYVNSHVKYGTRKSQLHVAARSHYSHFTETNQYGLQHWYQAVLTRLKPNTVYFYQVQAGMASRSLIYKFRTLPQQAEQGKWMPKFLVYGDLGLHTQRLESIITEGLTRGYDAVLHLGDIAYNLFTLQGLVGDNFQKKMEPLAAQLPYLTTPGDHEMPHHFIHYRHRFSMPGVPYPMPEEKLWYSLDIGNVHVISYSSEVFFHSQSNIEKQFQWLVEDLSRAARNRLRVPWIIAIGHKPLYCSQSYPQDCNQKKSKVREGFEDLFYTYGVELVLQGHCHSYERSWPMYKGQPLAEDYTNPQAPVYIITGTTGNQYITDTISHKAKNIWSAYLMSKQEKESVGRLEILNDTHLLWQEVLTRGWKVIDQFVLVKDVHGPNADVDNFLQRVLANQSLENALLGPNLALAKGHFTGLRLQFNAVMAFAFVFVVILFIFRATITDFMESFLHRVKYVYHGKRKFEYMRQVDGIRTV